jgi:hypothetical protein
MRNVVCATDGFTVSNEKQNAAATHNLLGLMVWFIGYLHLQHYKEGHKRVVCNVTMNGFVPEWVTAQCDK